MKKLIGNSANKIFITGGAGFIGSHLCDHLISDGYIVTVYDNFSNGKKEFIEHHLDSPNFKLVEADCLDLNSLKEELKDHDLVWHLAANTDIIGSHAQPDRDLKDCAIATFNVLEAMKINGVKKILFSSTGAVYGKLCIENFVKESAGPLSPMSSYGAGKIASEAFIQTYCHLYDIRGWIFRFGNVIGSRATHGVLLDFIKKLKNNPKELLVLGDGTQEKNYFLTEECIAGMAWAFQNITLDDSRPCEIFNLGTDSVTNVIDIAEIIIGEMGLTNQTKIKIQGSRYAWLGDQPKVHLNIDKINKEGWYCKNTSTEAVKIAVQRMLKEFNYQQ
jgi:UDP-glucose 4-epimerase